MKYTNTNATRREKQNSIRRKRNDAYTTARRDSSADWRTEYEGVHVDPRGHELRSDGGTRFVLPSEGTIVYDEFMNVLGDWDSVDGVRTAVVEGEVRSYTLQGDRLAATRGGEDE